MALNKHAWLLADLPKANGPKVMSTFACGGGSSMGYKRAGCEVIAANDIDPQMAKHYKLNINPKHYFLCPVGDLLGMDLPNELHELDILDGSPPCSTFSTAGSREKSWSKDKHFREGQAKQVLSDLFFDYLNLVEKLRPRVSVAENVKGMVLGNAKGYVKLVMERYRKIGYRPQLFLLNAADCGVPQRRERVFFCAVREDVSSAPLKIDAKQPWSTVDDACADVQSLTEDERRDTAFTAPTDLKWWSLTQKGEHYSNAVIRAGLPEKLFSHTKIDPSKPSCTLTAASDKFKHWSEPRHLSTREWIRLGSFPDDYRFETHAIGKYMIGMSVPPKMAEVVARAVTEQWLK